MDLSLDGLVPRRVARPETTDDLVAIVRGINNTGEAGVVWGGGTRITIGAPLTRYDVAIDMTMLRGVVEHSPADLVCTVRAGTTLAELAAALAPARQRWPVEVADPARATVGGTIASAAPSPSRLRFQHPRDWIIGCSTVLGDGTLARAGGRVVKNVTGYDLTRLYSGSYGTLAVLAEVSLKLVALDDTTVTVALRDDPARLRDIALRLRALPVDAIVLAVGPASVLQVRVGGSAASVARMRREISAIGAFVEASDLSAPPGDARLATAPGHEADDLVPGLVAFIGTGIAYIDRDADLRAKRAALEAAGGALVLERGSVDDKRALGVWGAPRVPSAIAHALKVRFDPSDVLAPGRMPT